MIKSLNPLYVLLGGFYFFYFALVGVYVIFIPKTLVDFNYTAMQVGIVYAAAPFMRFLLPFLFKHYIALTPKIYISSLAFTFISTIIFIESVYSFEFFLAMNLIFGASMGIALPYIETIALSNISKQDYGKVRLWGSIGFMGIALWLGQVLNAPEETLYYLSGMAFFTLLFGLRLTAYDTTEHSSANDDASFSLKKYWAFWVSVFLMQVAFGGYYNFFTIYETSYGVSLEMISWMWSFGVLIEIVMLYFQGPLLQRNLLNILMFATLVTSFRWFILYIFADNTTITFISQSLHAISFALYHTAAITYVFSLYTQKKLAQQFFLGISFGLGGSVGSLLAGEFYGEYLFAIESAITFVAFIVLFLHQYRKKGIA